MKERDHTPWEAWAAHLDGKVFESTYLELSDKHDALIEKYEKIVEVVRKAVYFWGARAKDLSLPVSERIAAKKVCDYAQELLDGVE